MSDYGRIPVCTVSVDAGDKDDVYSAETDVFGSEENDLDQLHGKQVVVGICAMEKKSQSKPMREILTRLEEFEYIRTIVFPEDVILKV